MNETKLTGLTAAPHTPFHRDGTLNLTVVEIQAARLLEQGVKSVFIGGTTGESHSLALEVGPARLPNGNLGAAHVAQPRCDLEALGFFDWIKH